ncbi:aminopeptidase P family protein [Neorickettsia sennetsu]|uniref:Metallopeptidase, M24 family n=1 Tax=Ehrlichia sennetsu (strain ATCC VR-367 / Miyayama) TaxID=222891 RepID=Q2GDU0_EHRS3|nr:aminopeptidase P family protein [Neorickettsia sennetsu]ABD45717.1 metallopeptidase, M24 family [Neorickettsia sennetsu str. Miyayama]
MITPEEKLSALRRIMEDNRMEGFLITISDEFLLESPLSYNNRIKWLTGFCGSFAMVLITCEKAYFFTDSRYLIQVKLEVSEIYTRLQFSLAEIERVIKESCIRRICYDSRLLNRAMLSFFRCQMEPLDWNPIDCLWDRNTVSVGRVVVHPLCYAGLSSQEKCKQIINITGGNNYFFSNSESVCWLANIRGSDLEYTPVVCCRAILYSNGLLRIFLWGQVEDLPSLESHIEILRLEELQFYLTQLKSVALDEQSVNIYYLNLIRDRDIQITHLQDPSVIMRACKNHIELEGSIAAHKRDGLALTKFLNWLKVNESSDELASAEMLLSFRKEQELFFSLSFPTISAFGPHGAIVHYTPSKKSNLQFKPGNLYLVDSGAQYLDGTTDVTRTVAIGEPTEEQKFHYTIVLKAHIGLAKAVFPAGTTGRQLDVLARSHLWSYKLDYAHGTGHGVGSFLNVHEGPHSFGSEVPLKVGMIISNEPGLYFEGKYGIRLENLMYVKEAGDGFLSFAPLTLVNFDENLIRHEMLSDSESRWLEDYSDLVRTTHRS